ncbi:hypothetical protein [Actinoplanes sp. G11-F43]|uniref:hypothetical protein n=1 Tax=Actinoplanes sp. G11-F43 TaxID=3424130 RepID=UPI003D359312
MSIESAELVNCPARITLDTAQQAFLDKLPVAAPSLRSELGCELEEGHEGSHAALAQQVDDTMWWAQWTLSASEINPYTWCPAGPPAPSRDDKDCSLFDGHPGRHSPGTHHRQES